MKYILLAAVAFLLVWWIRRPRNPGDGPAGAGDVAEPMIACSHCDLHVPRTEAYQRDGRHFCSPAHAQAYAARSARD